MKIVMVTGNKWKFESASKCLEKYGIELEQVKMETPEIQSLDSEEIAKYSAKFAAEELDKPVFVTDAGAEIVSLNNFPGPFLKYMNIWFSSEEILALMEGKEDRSVRAIDCIAYCEPGKEPVSFVSVCSGVLATKPEGQGSALDRIMIWEGMDRPQGCYDSGVMTDYWAENNSVYRQFGEYISEKETV